MTDFLNFNNCFFVCDQINEDMLYNFDDFFTTLENLHSYNTRTRKNNTIIKTLPNSRTYGLYSVRHRAIPEWSEITRTINTIKPYLQN